MLTVSSVQSTVSTWWMHWINTFWMSYNYRFCMLAALFVPSVVKSIVMLDQHVFFYIFNFKLVFIFAHFIYSFIFYCCCLILCWVHLYFCNSPSLALSMLVWQYLSNLFLIRQSQTQHWNTTKIIQSILLIYSIITSAASYCSPPSLFLPGLSW